MPDCVANECTCGYDAVVPDKLCARCSRIFTDCEERDNNYRLHKIWRTLDELCKSVCPGCRDEVQYQDEMVGPAWFVHIGFGKCLAYQFRMVGAALDDLRDQHFNTKFYPENTQRMGNRCLLCHLPVDDEHR